MVAESAPRTKPDIHLTRPAEAFELSHFLFRLAAMPEVARLGYTPGSRQVDLWVFVEHEDFEVNERIYELHDSFRDTEDPEGIQLHIVPMDRVKDAALPTFRELPIPR